MKGMKLDAAMEMGITPVKGIKYRSSNKKVASVSKTGVVKGGSKSGTAIITAYTFSKTTGTAGEVMNDTAMINATNKKVETILGSFQITNEIPKLAKMEATRKGEILDANSFLSGVSSATVTSWRSSKSSVAQIDESGNIIVNGKGTTTISAVFGSGKNAKKYSAKLKVVIPKLSKTSKRIKNGKKTKLTLKNTKKTPSWSSSNTAVVSVISNGRSCTLTGVGAGTTEVMASLDGVDYICSVTVYE